MSPIEVLGYGFLLLIFVVGVVMLLNRYAPQIMSNQFPDKDAREQKEKMLTQRVEELERKNVRQEEELKGEIKDLRLTIKVLSNQLDVASDKIGALKVRIQELEKELLAVQRAQHASGERRTITVLGIWPLVAGQVALDQQGEADALYDAGYTYVALRGARATRTGIIWEVDRVQPTILQIGGHGDKDGIMLSDGTAEPGWWAELVTGRNIQLVVLMSCDSSQQDEYNVSDALLRGGVRAVISCDGQIDDTDAVKFTQFLYGKMAENMPLAQALQRAKLSVSRKSAEMIRLREGKR
jgi:hypothetical protein